MGSSPLEAPFSNSNLDPQTKDFFSSSLEDIEAANERESLHPKRETSKSDMDKLAFSFSSPYTTKRTLSSKLYAVPQVIMDNKPKIETKSDRDSLKPGHVLLNQHKKLEMVISDDEEIGEKTPLKSEPHEQETHKEKSSGLTDSNSNSDRTFSNNEKAPPAVSLNEINETEKDKDDP